MERKELVKLALDFVKKTQTVALITIHDRRPHVRPVSGLIVEEKRILISTATSSRKIEHLKDDPHMALYAYSDKEFTYCTLSGRGALNRDKALREKHWKKDLERYFPKGVDDPEYCFIDMEIRGVDYVNYSKGFDNPVIHREAW